MTTPPCTIWRGRLSPGPPGEDPLCVRGRKSGKLVKVPMDPPFEWNGILACERPHRLRVTWAFGESTSGVAASALEIRLSATDAGATRFELEHTAEAPEEAWAAYGPGAVGGVAGTNASCAPEPGAVS